MLDLTTTPVAVGDASRGSRVGGSWVSTTRRVPAIGTAGVTGGAARHGAAAGRQHRARQECRRRRAQAPSSGGAGGGNEENFIVDLSPVSAGVSRSTYGDRERLSTLAYSVRICERRS